MRVNTIGRQHIGVCLAVGLLVACLGVTAQANMIIDLVATGISDAAGSISADGKTVTAAAVGDVVTFSLYMLPQGTTPSTTGLQLGAGAVLQTRAIDTQYKVRGDLGGMALDPAWKAGTGWSVGLNVDLANPDESSFPGNKDGDKDIGSVLPDATPGNFLNAVAGAMTYSPPSTGFMVGTFTYTVTGLGPGPTDTLITYAPRKVAAAWLWKENGSIKTGTSGLFTIHPVTITAAGGPIVPALPASLGDNPAIFGTALVVPVAGLASYADIASVVGSTTGSGGSPVLLLGTGGAKILAGVNGDTAMKQFNMAWRGRTTAEGSNAAPWATGGLFGNVVQVMGMDKPVGQTWHGAVQTDAFVLQMDYDAQELTRIWGDTEQQAAAKGAIYLGYLDLGPDRVLGGGDDRWHAAVAGNFTGTSMYVGDRAYDPALDAPGGVLAVGHYGVDTAHDQVWAILDHNSQFAPMPEPGTLTLLGCLGVVGLLISRRFRRK